MLFKKATKEKFRFMTSRGNLTVEDLWDLPLVEIDALARSLSRAVKESAEESFITKKSAEAGRLDAKFELVKAVITQRLEDISTAENRAKEAAKKEKYLSIIEEKEDEELRATNIDDLKKMAADLQTTTPR
jgi:DNA gyrase/topoisomerase IV subunit A